MGAAAAQVCGESLAHVMLGRPWIAVEQVLRGHDHSIDAIAALSRLLIDEGLLQRVRLLNGSEALDRRDLGVTNRPNLCDAGACRSAVNQHGASATLGQPAPELGTVKREIVAQDVKEGRIGFGWNRVACTVDLEANGHGVSSTARRAKRGF